MEEKNIETDSALKYKISPSYNFMYELGMATGKKTKGALIITIICIIFLIAGIIISNYLFGVNGAYGILKFRSIFVKVMAVLIALFAVKTVIHIILQIIQYKNITYNFYEDRLEYKDMFINQKTKIIRYDSIREIEIIRDVWERINGLGIIVIYTNAEKSKNSGLVIYGVKNTDDVYNKINDIISKKGNIQK